MQPLLVNPETQGKNVMFIQFCIECISMFGLCTKRTLITSTNASKTSGEQKMTHSQTKRKKILKCTELTEQQRKETENLKATQATRVSPQQLVTISQAIMSCMYVGPKNPSSECKNNDDK